MVECSNESLCTQIIAINSSAFIYRTFICIYLLNCFMHSKIFSGRKIFMTQFSYFFIKNYHALCAHVQTLFFDALAVMINVSG